MVVTCGAGILVSAQSSEKEGVTNRDIVSRRRSRLSPDYKDSLGYKKLMGCFATFRGIRGPFGTRLKVFRGC